MDARYAFAGVPRTINGEIIRLPARWSRYYPAVYEPAKTQFLREHVQAGDTVIDLGAHIGVYTAHLARCVGPRGSVFAFEPAPRTCAVLRRTVLLNGLADVVTVREEAVAALKGETLFHEAGGPCPNASGLFATVASTTLGHLSQEIGGPLRFIKMDIEGAELDVISAGAEVLASDRPAMTIEVHPVELQSAGRHAVEVYDELRRLGYRIVQDGRPVDVALFHGSACFEVQALHERSPRT
jgi:FkbM family methyltransferase